MVLLHQQNLHTRMFRLQYAWWFPLVVPQIPHLPMCVRTITLCAYLSNTRLCSPMLWSFQSSFMGRPNGQGWKGNALGTVITRVFRCRLDSHSAYSLLQMPWEFSMMWWWRNLFVMDRSSRLFAEAHATYGAIWASRSWFRPTCLSLIPFLSLFLLFLSGASDPKLRLAVAPPSLIALCDQRLDRVKYLRRRNFFLLCV